MKHAPGFLAIVNDAKSRVAETDVAGVHALRQAGEPFFLVDVKIASGLQGTCRARSTSGAVSLSATSKRKFRRKMRRSSSIAAVDSVLPWPQTIFKKWAIQT